MLRLLLLSAVITAAFGRELCSRDEIPDLDGAWVCDNQWLISIDERKGEFEESTKWVLLFELPQFYAVSKIRAVSVCPHLNETYLLQLTASVWDEKFDIKDRDTIHEADQSKWIDLEIPNVGFVGGGSQEYSGFAYRAPYWRLEIETLGIDIDCIPEFIFFARAGVAAVQHYTMGVAYEVPNSMSKIFAGYGPLNAPTGNTCDTVTGVPPNIASYYKLDMSFYRKYTSAYGIPILSSSVVDDRALQRACYVVRFMMADRKDIRDHMHRNKGRVAIIGRRETVPMVPEMRIFPWFNRRAAGGTFQIPVNVGAEENMLCEAGDGYARNQDIFMHEFAHGVHLIACYTAIPNFNNRLQQSFNSARRRGLWTNTYANTDNREYFAEGVQAYFNQQREGPVGGDGIQNHINTREELQNHDPTLYRIIDELFPCYNEYIPRCNDVSQARGLLQGLKMDCGGTATTPPPTVNPNCADNNLNCRYWADNGECGKNPDYMLVNCKKSCDNCKSTTTTTTTTTAPTTTTTTPVANTTVAETTTTNTQTTTSQSNVTEPITTSNATSTTAGSTTQPPTTTASTTTTTTTTTEKPTTPTPCVDENPSCSYWAGIGECYKNPGYMKKSCRKSCNECKGGSGCSNSDAICPYWSMYCYTNPYVIVNCKKTCNRC